MLLFDVHRLHKASRGINFTIKAIYDLSNPNRFLQERYDVFSSVVLWPLSYNCLIQADFYTSVTNLSPF